MVLLWALSFPGVDLCFARAELRRHDPARSALAASGRVDAARRAEWVRLRVDVRLARALAGAVPAADARGDEHRAAEAWPERDQPRHARADRHRQRLRHPPGHFRRTDGRWDRPGRLRTARDPPAAH